MPAPIRAAFLAWKSHRLRQYVAQASRAREIQQQVLLEKIRRNALSDFGRRHGFVAIHDVKSFRERVPISTYEDYRPYIERVMQGDTSAMFNPGTRVLMFAITSGTTAQPKHLPVTDAFYRDYRESWQLWGTGAFRDYPHLMRKQTLQLTSDWQTSFTPCGIPCGNISGLAAATRPFYTKRIFSLPACVIKIRDYAAKHYTSLRVSMTSRQVAFMITANPSTLVEYARRADELSEQLIRDIYDGTLTPPAEIPDQVRHALRRRLRPHRRRARELEELRSRHDGLYPQHFWPQLDLLAVWTGGSVGIYLPQLEKYYGPLPIRDHGISASEGRMTIPLANNTPDGMLDFGHQFFEFIPAEEHGHPDPTVLQAHELEPDRNYFILLTTSGGLYRYDIHDMLRCVGFEGEAPILRFLNKGKHFSSLTGEKLSEHQVALAVTNSLEELGLPSCSFTLAPSMEGEMTDRPRYELLLEPGPQLEQGRRLSHRVQQQLCEVNEEYRDKCDSGRLQPITLRALPSGTWAALRRERSRARGNFEEFKQPLLVADLDYANRLASLVTPATASPGAPPAASSRSPASASLTSLPKQKPAPRQKIAS